jgi:hypothetical protein
MGIVLAAPGSIGRAGWRFGRLQLALRELWSGALRRWLAFDRARDDVRSTRRPAGKGHGLARHALTAAVVGIA